MTFFSFFKKLIRYYNKRSNTHQCHSKVGIGINQSILVHLEYLADAILLHDH